MELLYICQVFMWTHVYFATSYFFIALKFECNIDHYFMAEIYEMAGQIYPNQSEDTFQCIITKPDCCE